MSAIDELTSLLPPSVTALLHGSAPLEVSASAVASFLADEPRFRELVAALTDAAGPCAKDAAACAAASEAAQTCDEQRRITLLGDALRSCPPSDVRTLADLHARRAAALATCGEAVAARREADRVLALDATHPLATDTLLRLAAVAISVDGGEALYPEQPLPPRLPESPDKPLLRVGPSPLSGDGTFACRDLKPGDVLLVENPLSARVHKPQRATRCGACFRRLPPEGAQPGCATCGACRSCGRDGCTSSLTASCAALLAANPGAAWPSALPADAVLAAQVALIVASEPAGSEVARRAAALATHWGATKRGERTSRALISATIAACMQPPAKGGSSASSSPPVSAHDVLRAQLWLRSNSFAVCDEWAVASRDACSPQRDFGESLTERGELRVAQALYLSAASVNHSCVPNAHVSFAPGGALILRAISNIAAGDEILISYGPCVGQAPSSTRRALLSASHGFVCRCAGGCDGSAASAAADARLTGVACPSTPACPGAVPLTDTLPCSAAVARATVAAGASHGAASPPAAPSPARPPSPHAAAAALGGCCTACGRSPGAAWRAAAKDKLAAATAALARAAAAAVAAAAALPSENTRAASSTAAAAAVHPLLAAHRSAAAALLSAAQPSSLAAASCLDGLARSEHAFRHHAAALAASEAALAALATHHAENSLPFAHEAAKTAALAAAAGAGDRAAALAGWAASVFVSHYGDSYPRLAEMAALGWVQQKTA